MDSVVAKQKTSDAANVIRCAMTFQDWSHTDEAPYEVFENQLLPWSQFRVVSYIQVLKRFLTK